MFINDAKTIEIPETVAPEDIIEFNNGEKNGRFSAPWSAFVYYARDIDEEQVTYFQKWEAFDNKGEAVGYAVWQITRNFDGTLDHSKTRFRHGGVY